jgi:hypothetical protein
VRRFTTKKERKVRKHCAKFNITFKAGRGKEGLMASFLGGPWKLAALRIIPNALNHRPALVGCTRNP